MFETRDMLPRQPPKPTQAIQNEGTIKPTVPEVSIIFNKEAPKNTDPQQTKNHISYADWKKQVLPRVAFPPILKDDGSVPTTSSIYPMRGALSIGKNLDNLQLRTNTGIYTNAPLPAPANGYNCENRQIPTVISSNLNNAQTVPFGTGVFINSPTSTVRPSRHSLESAQTQTMGCSARTLPAEQVLTICATTQTDAVNQNNPWGESTRNELNHLASIIKEMKEDQFYMRQLLEALITQKQMPAKVYCEAGIQCDIQGRNIPPFQLDNGTIHKALPDAKCFSPTLKENVRAADHMAQSTTYRPMTPQNTKQSASNNLQNTANSASLPKPNTEKSMVMNELALKYLPNDKLNELFQNVQIDQGTDIPKTTTPTTIQTPLREIENFNKAQTDLSNASYKYLRKYRLLSDQHQRTPPQNRIKSPYYQKEQGPESPIMCINEVNTEHQNRTESPHLDLEHIRRQPKFL